MNQAVDLAKCFNSALGCRDAFCPIGYVCTRLNKARSLICFDLIDWKRLQVHSTNAMAVRQQAFHASQADAARGSGDDDMLCRKIADMDCLSIRILVDKSVCAGDEKNAAGATTEAKSFRHTTVFQFLYVPLLCLQAG